ncbi:hypothetical protein [Rhodovulum marinum]|uniref:Uncharacterized protein n=1 Tax=Rhodovulum marinum TaxID=320662 RepID=A0A4R2PXR6_9RHOB|nr:hypothetical protein [Rhodovulum marinum]TCP40857.1 hypothetical protein EV662_10671 [Rhodovulum marinum]
MRRLALVAVFSAIPVSGLSQSEPEPLPTRYLCVRSATPDPDEMPTTVLEMLDYVRRQLSAARILEFNGATADFEQSLPADPYHVQARHNEVSIMSRGYLMDGGPQCAAHSAADPLRACNWSFREITDQDQSSDSVRLVWETAVLDGNTLKITSIVSGQVSDTVEVFDCEEADEVERHLNR